jgi:hypothetical protein
MKVPKMSEDSDDEAENYATKKNHHNQAHVSGLKSPIEAARNDPSLGVHAPKKPVRDASLASLPWKHLRKTGEEEEEEEEEEEDEEEVAAAAKPVLYENVEQKAVK